MNLIKRFCCFFIILSVSVFGSAYEEHKFIPSSVAIVRAFGDDFDPQVGKMINATVNECRDFTQLLIKLKNKFPHLTINEEFYYIEDNISIAGGHLPSGLYKIISLYLSENSNLVWEKMYYNYLSLRFYKVDYNFLIKI